MRHRSYVKEGTKKLKETIRDLRASLRHSEKEIRFLKEELLNIMKPGRDRKKPLPTTEVAFEDWKKDFIKRFNVEVLGKRE